MRSDFARQLKQIISKISLLGVPQAAKSDILQEKLVFETLPISLKGLKLVAVDGGLLNRSLRGIDINIVRAIGVIFQFDPEDNPISEYFPKAFPAPKLLVDLNPGSSRESQINASLERALSELRLIVDLLDQHTCNLILLDGSIIPQPGDKPHAPSLITDKYSELIDVFETVYTQCLRQNILFAGIIKDSRQTRFTEILGRVIPFLKDEIVQKIMELDYRKALSSTRDTDILYRILEPGERTCVFKSAKAPFKHPTLMDFHDKKWGRMINAFYLKTVQYDHPIRIEFLSTEPDPIQTAKKIAGVTLNLSSHNAEFGFPSILVEADARAQLVDNDLDFIVDEITNKTQDINSLKPLRRAQKPFY